MAIANSCYIRNIQKAEQTLLKKADVKFSLNTTSSILMRVLKEFFPNQITIEKQSENIQKLERELAVFKIHSSDIEFKKSEYEYIKIQ
tara:strand:+ start:951 stop:1214 length:264 start_codon:yes stop_codon:yes gene_type:complete